MVDIVFCFSDDERNCLHLSIMIVRWYARRFVNVLKSVFILFVQMKECFVLAAVCEIRVGSIAEIGFAIWIHLAYLGSDPDDCSFS